MFSSDNIQTIQDFVFYLFPGFVAVSFYYYQKPARAKSETVFIIATVFTSVFLKNFTEYLIPIFRSILQVNFSLPTASIGFFLVSISVGLISAYILTKIIDGILGKILYKWLGLNKLYPDVRVWNKFFTIKEIKKSFVKVLLSNDLSYVGSVRESSIDPNDSMVELTLEYPHYYNRETGEAIKIKDITSVLIEGSSIVSVEQLTEEKAAEFLQ